MTGLLLDLSDEQLLQGLRRLALLLLRLHHHWVAASTGHVLKVPSHDLVILCDDRNFVTKPDEQASGPVVAVSDVSAVPESAVSPLASNRGLVKEIEEYRTRIRSKNRSFAGDNMRRPVNWHARCLGLPNSLPHRVEISIVAVVPSDLLRAIQKQMYEGIAVGEDVAG
jgi:hypothetical protein